MKQTETKSNEYMQINEKPFLGLIPYLLSSVFILVCYVFFYDLALQDDGYGIEKIEKIMMFSILGIIFVSLIVAYFNKLSFTKLIAVIILIGIIMRLGYMLYTSYDLRQHDLGEIDSPGHLGYIYTIFKTWQLPSSNSQQFYHPPLFHIFGAIAMKISSIFTSDETTLLNSIRLIPCLASTFTLIVSYKILKNLHFSKKAIILALSIVAVHPTFIILSASINNDMLSIFFLSLTILYLIKWYNNKCIKNIVLMALALGLGMMTKLSVVLMAPVIALVFIYAFMKKKRKDKGNLLSQYLIFGAVSVPLGLWYSIRNFLLFNQSLGYVLKLSTRLQMYLGEKSLVSRFFSFPIAELTKNIFPNVESDYNIIVYMIKSSLFGEWSYKGYEIPAIFLTVTSMILILISLISMVYVFMLGKDKKMRFAKWVLGLIFLIQIASYIKFNIDYPFGCTMDFRYIVITIFTGAAFIAAAYDILSKRHKHLSNIIFIILCLLILLFAVSSIWFYTTI